MDFMTHGELDGYLVWIFFMLKKKKSWPSNNLRDLLDEGNI